MRSSPPSSYVLMTPTILNFYATISREPVKRSDSVWTIAVLDSHLQTAPETPAKTATVCSPIYKIERVRLKSFLKLHYQRSGTMAGTSPPVIYVFRLSASQLRTGIDIEASEKIICSDSSGGSAPQAVRSASPHSCISCHGMLQGLSLC